MSDKKYFQGALAGKEAVERLPSAGGGPGLTTVFAVCAGGLCRGRPVCAERAPAAAALQDQCVSEQPHQSPLLS